MDSSEQSELGCRRVTDTHITGCSYTRSRMFLFLLQTPTTLAMAIPFRARQRDVYARGCGPSHPDSRWQDNDQTSALAATGRWCKGTRL